MELAHAAWLRGRRLGQWRMLADVADQLGVGEAVADKAAAFAVTRAGGESDACICLTDASRRREG